MSKTPETPDLPRLVRGRFRSGEAGFVLIAVLWFGLGLSAVASYLLISAQFQTRQAIARDVQARLAVETLDAAAHWAIAAIDSGDVSFSANTDQPMQLSKDFGGQTVAISLEPREARIDLNLDDPNRMALAFESQGMDGELALTLAARIVDFRDEDDLRSVNGAESRDYASAGLKGPRNGAFLVPEDLQRVLGMTPAAYTQIQPIVSVTARPITQVTEKRVTLTGNRLDPVGGRRASQSVRRPGIFIELMTEQGDRRSFAYYGKAARFGG